MSPFDSAMQTSQPALETQAGSILENFCLPLMQEARLRWVVPDRTKTRDGRGSKLGVSSLGSLTLR